MRKRTARSEEEKGLPFTFLLRVVRTTVCVLVMFILLTRKFVLVLIVKVHFSEFIVELRKLQTESLKCKDVRTNLGYTIRAHIFKEKGSIW